MLHAHPEAAPMLRDDLSFDATCLYDMLFVIQTALLAIVAATLLIRPILKHDTPEDGMLFISVPFAILVGLMMDNFSEMAITIDSLEVFHKQRASRFYPAWAFALPTSLLRIPYSFIMAGASTCILYYVMGFDPNPGRWDPTGLDSCMCTLFNICMSSRNCHLVF